MRQLTADRIHGLIERGRYEELVLRDGPFARLALAGEFVET